MGTWSQAFNMHCPRSLTKLPRQDSNSVHDMRDPLALALGVSAWPPEQRAEGAEIHVRKVKGKAAQEVRRQLHRATTSSA